MQDDNKGGKNLKNLRLLTITCIMLLCCVGCTKGETSELTLSGDVLVWEEAESAAHYEVEWEGNSVTSDEPKLALNTICKTAGEYTVTVYSISDTAKKKELGSITFDAKEQAKTAITVVESEGSETIFKWKVNDTAGECVYDLNDGYGTHKAEIGEDSTAQIVLEGTEPRTVTVTVMGTAKDNTYYIGNAVDCRYKGKPLFDFGQMTKYPFYIIANGGLGEAFLAAVTLPGGTYTLDITAAVMDSNGNSVVGNGPWGRRVHIAGIEDAMFYCENDVRDHRYFPVAGTLKPANETYTWTMENVRVDALGKIQLSAYDFNAGEMYVITDIRHNGKSVMATALPEEPKPENPFDVEKLNSFLATYTGGGANTTMDVPVDLPNGIYDMEISYQVMTALGGTLYGNGTGSRAVGNEWWTDYVYYNEYESGSVAATRIPDSKETVKSVFKVKVMNGKFTMSCSGFAEGEIVAVSAVKRVGGSTSQKPLDESNLSKYKNVFVEKVGGMSYENWLVQTNRKERAMLEVEVSYFVVDADGFPCMGNGVWGRRGIATGGTTLWLNGGTVTENSGNVVAPVLTGTSGVLTTKMTVIINRFGQFEMMMCDFNKGEKLVITDIKYEGNSIL